jgi:hypothetical protein
MLTHGFRTLSRGWHAFLGFGGVQLLPRDRSGIGHREAVVLSQSAQKRAREDEATDLNNFLQRERVLRQKKSHIQLVQEDVSLWKF